MNWWCACLVNRVDVIEWIKKWKMFKHMKKKILACKNPWAGRGTARILNRKLMHLCLRPIWRPNWLRGDMADFNFWTYCCFFKIKEKTCRTMKKQQFPTIQNILFVTFFAEQDFKHECHNFYYDILLFFGENCIYSECCHPRLLGIGKVFEFCIKERQKCTSTSKKKLKLNKDWIFSLLFFCLISRWNMWVSSWDQAEK